MANRLVGNVYIIDSQLNTVALPWPSTGRISSIRAWFSGTNGAIRFSGADTTNVICVLAPVTTPAPSGGTTDEAHLGDVAFSEMYVPTVTAGTAWIYLS